MPIYLNNANIAGYLVSAPDGTPTQGGLSRAKFTVALNNPRKARPEYIKCVAWGDRAEVLTRHAEKGQEIIVSGALEVTTWLDRNQMKHNTTEVVVKEFSLGTRPRSRTGSATIRKPEPFLPE